jgi:ribosomal protein S10
LVEHRTENPCVSGSSPLSDNFFLNMTYSFTCQLSVLSLDVQILYTFLKTFNKLKNKRIKLKIKEPSFLPKKINKITLLKSPHINKKSKEQFEIK